MTVVNQAGHGKAFDFAVLEARPAMQRSLAAVFAAHSRRWTAHRTAESYWFHLVVFGRFLSELEDPPEDLDSLTATMLRRWRARNIGSNNGRYAIQRTRTLLRRDPRLAAGPVAEELARRVPGRTPSKQSYEEDERERVILAARSQFRAALMRIRDNTLLLERWRAGDLADRSREGKLGRILDHVARTGDVPRHVMPSGQEHVTNRRLLGGASPEHTWGRLFPTRSELTALAVLLTDRFGWNLSCYDRLPTPTTAPSAAEATAVTYQVQVEKRRAGGGRWFSTENITDSGADSPGRLITQALEATAHARTLAAVLAPGTDLLMTARTGRLWRDHQEMDRPRPVGPLVFGISGNDASYWATLHKLGGSPFQRTRRTTVTREGRPLQHTRGTHESVYVLPDQRVQRASQAVFEDGAQEALAKTRETAFAGRLADTPAPSHQQTATADCEDETSSPWPGPDGGCAADFLLCLGCTNAHVHPGHHPRLAHLRQQVESLRSALPEHSWDQGWRNHYLRLDDLRDKVGPAAWNAALTRVSDTDRTVVDLLLKKDLTS
ncbi:hypothetical protein ACFP3U_36490 [Kitasatospora misakiensis]|uniref:Core-binding (CB) domain-containing protein n=1 Tax=Kitasatospora misakiensis TaxID=67330 RepID=A0ABW0XCZ2_9ACTN